ncbi:CAAX prenyl protease-related protein [Geomonas propionica]|uniref:CAAX prenyl protease-related protein n=1 Tax=Geomonas propionica TaxID=2798582 RepID=A0ABS0YTV4_9BACT|nr:CAAX prenyl protease-related protein [Geomonas propionica]MBJ6801405.1 CAAX prenyl protease-related protein [Geomonas propionica]
MIELTAKITRLDRGTLYRVLPFAIFMVFIGLDEVVRLLAGHQLLASPQLALHALYPVKVLSVALLLYLWRSHYGELQLKDLMRLETSSASIATGMAIFVLWINIPVTLPLIPRPAGFDPALFPEGAVRAVMVATRVTGAFIVVPVMEELFWRSFLLRYIIDPAFERVPLGRFTWGSFLAASLLFGLEHHQFAAGVIAGAAYSIVLYRTHSLMQCVLAHAVTNLALSLYVLHTGNWHYW